MLIHTIRAIFPLPSAAFYNDELVRATKVITFSGFVGYPFAAKALSKAICSPVFKYKMRAQ